MKAHLSKGPLATSFLFLAIAALPVQATLIVKVTDSSGVQTFQVGNANCPGCTANSIIVNDNDLNFSINLNIATSNAPGGPATLTEDLVANSTVGSVGTPNNLTIEISDTGFLSPSGLASLVQRGTTNEPATGFATGTTTSTGYYGTGGTGNIPFCQASGTCSGNTGPLVFASFALNTQQNQTNLNFGVPFSLDEVINASFTSAGTGQYTTSLSAPPAVVPEPASGVLLGSALACGIFLFRRKLRSDRASRRSLVHFCSAAYSFGRGSASSSASRTSSR